MCVGPYIQAHSYTCLLTYTIIKSLNTYGHGWALTSKYTGENILAWVCDYYHI